MGPAGRFCPLDVLRRAVRDVQLHPVKMLIFIRFSEDKFRDEVVERIEAGIPWKDYQVMVKWYSLDSEVIFIRLLGAIPETEASEINKGVSGVGYWRCLGNQKKGFLDSNTLPGVANGT